MVLVKGSPVHLCFGGDKSCCCNDDVDEVANDEKLAPVGFPLSVEGPLDSDLGNLILVRGGKFGEDMFVVGIYLAR